MVALLVGVANKGLNESQYKWTTAADWRANVLVARNPRISRLTHDSVIQLLTNVMCSLCQSTTMLMSRTSGVVCDRRSLLASTSRAPTRAASGFRVIMAVLLPHRRCQAGRSA